LATGIYQLEYQLPGATKAYPKTVYDPSLYPNMDELANFAANKGLVQYQMTGDLLNVVVVDGIKFTVPIKIKNGIPYVPTVFPTGVVK
jgi:filamentous hemagglutinin